MYRSAYSAQRCLRPPSDLLLNHVSVETSLVLVATTEGGQALCQSKIKHQAILLTVMQAVVGIIKVDDIIKALVQRTSDKREKFSMILMGRCNVIKMNFTFILL